MIGAAGVPSGLAGGAYFWPPPGGWTLPGWITAEAPSVFGTEPFVAVVVGAAGVPALGVGDEFAAGVPLNALGLFSAAVAARSTTWAGVIVGWTTAPPVGPVPVTTEDMGMLEGALMIGAMPLIGGWDQVGEAGAGVE